MIHAVRLVIVSHQPTFRFLCFVAFPIINQPAAFLFQRRYDLGGILRSLIGAHCVFLITPLVAVVIKIAYRQGHVELEGLERRRQDGEGVLADHHAQAASVIPGDMERADVVEVLERAHGTRLDGARIVRAHLPQLDSGAVGVLLPQEIQPFFVDAHILILSSGFCAGIPSGGAQKIPASSNKAGYGPLRYEIVFSACTNALCSW